MKIIKASKKDFKKIAEIMLKEFGKPPFKDKAPLKNVLSTLRFYYKIGKIFVFKLDKEIIGATIFKIEKYWEGSVIIIEDLVIDSKYKNKSYGKNLMKFVEDYAKKRKIKRILFTTNKKSKAVSFYKKIGYKKEKDRINMAKKLK